MDDRQAPEAKRSGSRRLHRSDCISISKDETNESAKNYLGEAFVPPNAGDGDSVEMGYIFSNQDTQEVVRTESSSWMSEEETGLRKCLFVQMFFVEFDSLQHFDIFQGLRDARKHWEGSKYFPRLFVLF